MARSVHEKARFRGDDKAYADGWDRIFKKKEVLPCPCCNYAVNTEYITDKEARCKDCGRSVSLINEKTENKNRRQSAMDL